MTAARNVYGNVREYDTDLDVFGNVFEWPEEAVTAPNSGWTATTRTRLAIATDRNRLAISASKERVWIAEGK